MENVKIMMKSMIKKRQRLRISFFSPPQGDTERRKTKIYREYGIYGECGKYFYLGGSGAKRGTSCYKVN